jgi:hypothetical protein
MEVDHVSHRLTRGLRALYSGDTFHPGGTHAGWGTEPAWPAPRPATSEVTNEEEGGGHGQVTNKEDRFRSEWDGWRQHSEATKCSSHNSPFSVAFAHTSRLWKRVPFIVNNNIPNNNKHA